MSLVPLLVVALLVWAGLFAFLMLVERRVADVERRVERLGQESEVALR